MDTLTRRALLCSFLLHGPLLGAMYYGLSGHMAPSGDLDGAITVELTPAITKPVSQVVVRQVPHKTVQAKAIIDPVMPAHIEENSMGESGEGSRILKRVAPRYPDAARRAHQTGTTQVALVITPQGSVEDVQIHESSGYDLLDAAARDAVSQWRFSPPKNPVEAVIPITFSLKEKGL